MRTPKIFSDLPIGGEILDALGAMGFWEPTPIQKEAIPPMLEGRDVIGQAQTGTGKTAAFGIPLVERIPRDAGEVRALVLVPTRELAEQVAGELNEIGQFKGVTAIAVYGGAGFGPQIAAFRDGTQIVVGTPGRVMDHMRRGNLRLGKVQTFILDEADRMLDMGFIEDIEWVMKRLTSGVQILLFSATMPTAIETLANSFMKRPVRVAVSEDKLTLDGTEQVFINVGYRNKVWALYRVLEEENPDLAFVFVRTKMEADKVAHLLLTHGYLVEALHGDMTQSVRNRVMDSVRAGSTRVVVATDVLARGIDVSHCSHVINYDIPEDPEWYVHRIGRTGRMGKTGKAITFITSEERRALIGLLEVSGRRLKMQDVPEPEHLVKDKIKKVMDWKELADPPGMVHFKLDIGSRDGVKMIEVFNAVNRKCDFYDGTLGGVRVHESETIVEVPYQVAPRFYNAYRQGKLFGKPVKAEVVPRGGIRAGE